MKIDVCQTCWKNIDYHTWVWVEWKLSHCIYCKMSKIRKAKDRKNKVEIYTVIWMLIVACWMLVLMSI